MCRYHVLTLLPCLAASFARAQTSDATAPDTSVSPPIYTSEQCNSWVGVLVASDGDASNGLSNNEYYSFLSNIAEPRYIAEYFGGYAGFDQLPWVFRVVQKSLACHCEKLGFGGKCCEGDDAEVLLSGLGNSTTLSPSAKDEYKDLFCQQIAYVLAKAISSPAPTAAPSAVPSARPTEAPTVNPLTSPSSATPTAAPVKRPTTSPVAAPIAEPVVAPTSLRPTATPTQQEVIPRVGTQIVRDDRKPEGGLGTGAIIGITAALFAVLLAIIALVAYHRHKEEEAHVREFAGSQAPEADLEVLVASRALVPAPELAIARAPAEDDDDDSLAPSVWSDGEAGETLGELHDDHDDPGVTAGSALAAMGAASTVTARISATNEGIV